MEAIAAETRESVREAKCRFAGTSAPGIRSGQHEASLIRLRIEGVERIGRALSDIWVDLIEQKNGHIARADVDFIARKVEEFTNPQPMHIQKASAMQGEWVVPSVIEEARNRMHALCSGIRRELEIQARENELFPSRRQEGKAVANVPKKRFSVGRRVLVGMGMRPAVIKSFDDAPSVMGEYAHLVEFDDNHEQRRVLGCDMQPVPELDQDLRTSGPTINIHNSNVGNLNLGNQVGDINVAVQQLSKGDEAQREFAKALDEFTKAVVAATLPEPEKREAVDALSTIAEQATRQPEERSQGTIKAVLAYLPKAIATAFYLTELWGKYEPVIKAHFGL
jgi:hypothetical protein